MTSSDGERLAPVTWLFGPPEPTGQDAHARADSPSASSAAPPRGAAALRLAPEPQARPSLDELSEAMERIIAENPVDAEKSTTAKREKFERINNVSMHALGRRGMSTAEMRDYLLARDFDDDDVDAELDRLLRVGLLDDMALAETLVRTLRERKELGRAALVAELRRRKLDSDAIDTALESLDDNEFERALQLAQKRASQLRSLDDDTARRRLGAFLMRKGYSGGIVQSVVERALSRNSGGPVFR